MGTSLNRPIVALLAAVALGGGCQSPLAAPSGEDADLQLPASFTGAFPCHDCPGTRAHLDLWPDGVFHLRRTHVDKPGHDDDLGRWRRDPERPVILLYGGREMPLQLEVIGPRRLRALDLAGTPAGSGPAYDLASDGQLRPTDLSRGLHGMFRYMADAAQFEECLTGRSYPVAMEDEHLALERAYVALPKPAAGAPILASFEGDIVQRAPMEGPGTVPTVVVRRFVGLWPGQTCERAMSHASLANQYWRIARLRGTPAGPIEGSREPQLILRDAQGGYSASAGCERFNGAYRVEGPQIAFDVPPAVGTCPPALQAQQHALVEALSAARQWSIQGQVLELFDAAGTPVAVLEAVYLR